MDTIMKQGKVEAVLLAETGLFSSTACSFVQEDSRLESFRKFSHDWKGFEDSLTLRKENYSATTREVLCTVLESQYRQLNILEEKVAAQIQKLRLPNTFVVTTAHQPNLFTGFLYFFYKILHTARLAEEAAQRFPQQNFVPIFYMGSEDADLDELGTFFLHGKKFSWHTSQRGAVGRMKTKDLKGLLLQFEQEIAHFPFAEEVIGLINSSYRKASTIQEATHLLVHQIFSRFGILVVMADHPDLKRLLLPVFEKELFSEYAHPFVQNSIEQLNQWGFKSQANPRKINLFYLKEDIRERIERMESNGNVYWQVVNTEIQFSELTLRQELQDHPERFSPNVVLRPVYQETILPGVAFVGGGGEIAYWLQYRALFESLGVHFPQLILRNSFQLVEQELLTKIHHAGFSLSEMFNDPQQILTEFAKKHATGITHTEMFQEQLRNIYRSIEDEVKPIDPTLVDHVAALQTQAISKLKRLDEKILRAEKRKHQEWIDRFVGLQNRMMPNGKLQERTENGLLFHAVYGSGLVDLIYQNIEPFSDRLIVLNLP
jgi:bacillithiol biosynthesis cysteine-adding enzyme BshC